MKLRNKLPMNLALTWVPVIDEHGTVVGSIRRVNSSNYPAYKGRVTGYHFEPNTMGDAFQLKTTRRATLRETLTAATRGMAE